MSGFRKFLFRGNLIDLAVAVVIGAAFTAVVNALVKDLITPLLAAIGGKPNFSNLAVMLNRSRFLYGDFANAIVAFIIIAAVLYFLVVLPVAKFLALSARNKEATERTCPECLSEVPLAARRCMYCTSELPPATSLSG